MKNKLNLIKFGLAACLAAMFMIVDSGVLTGSFKITLIFHLMISLIFGALAGIWAELSERSALEWLVLGIILPPAAGYFVLDDYLNSTVSSFDCK
ncbi:MAG: hypothetical protein PHW04_13065 [Candidatus Wallbacteria bacterium]|nr:hypothetical protein [Candidatus Wallbacteria bacterium]